MYFVAPTLGRAGITLSAALFRKDGGGGQFTAQSGIKFWNDDEKI